MARPLVARGGIPTAIELRAGTAARTRRPAGLARCRRNRSAGVPIKALNLFGPGAAALT